MLSWVALNMVEGLKPIHKASLVRAFTTAENVFRQTEMELMAASEIRSDLAERILHFDFKIAEKEMRSAERSEVRIISLDDEHYPELLKAIPDPPLVLYVKGTLLKEEVTVAVVGSRKATPYGLNVTHALARDLGSAGVTIVSGLARGIDARAHNATLDVGGRTVAVLGSGLDVIYPAEHKMLAGKIVENGALLSEFPLGSAPNRDNFPIRNRIISGLSRLVIVIEARIRADH